MVLVVIMRSETREEGGFRVGLAFQEGLVGVDERLEDLGQSKEGGMVGVVDREDLGKLQGFHLGVQLLDLPSFSVGVFRQFDDPLEQAPAHFLVLFSLPAGKVRLVFAVRKMPFLLDLEDVLVTLTAVKHGIFRQLIDKFLRISLQSGHIIVVSPLQGGDGCDALVICLFFADWRGELPSMCYLRALELILAIHLESLHKFCLDAHRLVLHALLYLLSPSRLLSDLSPYPGAYLLPSNFFTQTRHDSKRPVQIRLPPFILLLKLLGAISHRPQSIIIIPPLDPAIEGNHALFNHSTSKNHLGYCTSSSMGTHLCFIILFPLWVRVDLLVILRPGASLCSCSLSTCMRLSSPHRS